MVHTVKGTVILKAGELEKVHEGNGCRKMNKILKGEGQASR